MRCFVTRKYKIKIVSGRGTYDNVSHGLHYWFDTTRQGPGLVTARFVLPKERFQVCVNNKVELPSDRAR